MNVPSLSKAFFSVAAMVAVSLSPVSADESLQAEDIQKSMLDAFKWQIDHLPTARAKIDSSSGLRGWVHGAFMNGVLEAYRTTQDQDYLDYAWKSAEECEWLPGPLRKHADDLVCIQSYADLYQIDPKRANITPSIEVIDELIAGNHNGKKLLWWCDALYMLPPSMTRLTKVTGDQKYTDEMVRLYWESVDFLYDREEKLFFRDKRFMPHHPEFKTSGFHWKKGTPEKYQEDDGKKMLWLRGNGWVFAGIVRILDDLPKDSPHRARFEGLYKEMAGRILELQQPDGLWRMGLLSQDAYPHGEVSGSAFFTYGLAWGVRNGYLDKATTMPAIVKAWHALRECQFPNGKLGYVQQIAGAPTDLKKDHSQEYGAGAYLMAGSEILKLLKK